MKRAGRQDERVDDEQQFRRALCQATGGVQFIDTIADVDAAKQVGAAGDQQGAASLLGT